MQHAELRQRQAVHEYSRRAPRLIVLRRLFIEVQSLVIKQVEDGLDISLERSEPVQARIGLAGVKHGALRDIAVQGRRSCGKADTGVLRGLRTALFIDIAQLEEPNRVSVAVQIEGDHLEHARKQGAA